MGLILIIGSIAVAYFIFKKALDMETSKNLKFFLKITGAVLGLMMLAGLLLALTQ